MECVNPGAEALRRSAVNTVTDTGGLFEAGDAVIGFTAGPTSGLISLGVSILCFAARASGEMKKSGWELGLRGKFGNAVLNNPATKNIGKLFNLLSNNLGASLMISGGAVLTSSAFAFYNACHGKELLPAIILASFGVANGIRGMARGLEKDSALQKTLDVAGIALAATGVILATGPTHFSDLTALKIPAYIALCAKTLFASAATIEAHQAIRAKPEKDVVRPNLVFAGGCFASALSCAFSAMTAANALFSVAYVSYDALKQKGGLYESLQSFRPQRSPS